MPKPIIGISVDARFHPEDAVTHGRLSLNWNYAEVVDEAGGVPLLIPPTADAEVVAATIHGWLIPGGADIDARVYGEANHETSSLIDPLRFEAERRLWSAIRPDLPVLGICYGCQFLNVALGGSLLQHLPDEVGHGEHAGGTLQRYEIDPDSLLAESAAARMEGRSFHHQAIGRLGRGLKVTARAEDRTIEAVEMPDRPWVVGVQWHPERSAGDGPTQALFRAFVKAARGYREGR